MAQEQSYANHAHRPMMSNVAALLATIALVLFLIEARRMTGVLAAALVALTASVIVLVAISRVYIVRLQDRIILLEMRMRLARLGRESDYGRLAKRQIIALRFASDAELPALIDRAVAENLTGRQIKQAIREWTPDYHRT